MLANLRCRFFVLDPAGLPLFRFSELLLVVAAEDAGLCPSDAFVAALGDAVWRLQNGAERVRGSVTSILQKERWARRKAYAFSLLALPILTTLFLVSPVLLVVVAWACSSADRPAVGSEEEPAAEAPGMEEPGAGLLAVATSLLVVMLMILCWAACSCCSISPALNSSPLPTLLFLLFFA
jgi:hypothetical protein